MKPDPTVEQIVRTWLVVHGYDGLFNPGLCACAVSDLAPCETPEAGCEAGYKRLGCDEDCALGCDFHIVREKPRPHTEAT